MIGYSIEHFDGHPGFMDREGEVHENDWSPVITMTSPVYIRGTRYTWEKYNLYSPLGFDIKILKSLVEERISDLTRKATYARRKGLDRKSINNDKENNLKLMALIDSTISKNSFKEVLTTPCKPGSALKALPIDLKRQIMCYL